MMNQKIIREDIEQLLSFQIPWERFYGKTILISGANGYVPSYFVHLFLALNDAKNANIKVIALCRNLDRAKKKIQ